MPTTVPDEIIKLKAQAEYDREMAKRDKEELKKELDELEVYKEIKSLTKNSKARQLIQKYQKIGLKLDNYIDNVEQFWQEQPFFYDKNKLFWIWNKEEYKYERTDEIDIMNKIDQDLGFAGQTVTNGIRGNYLEAFKRVGRTHIPKELSKGQVQFKDVLVNIKTGEETKATPLYFVCNPIPWKLGTEENTPTIDRIITEWVGQEYLHTAHQIIAYNAFPSYPIHILFALVGSGRNGKSRFIELLKRFVGQSNTTSTELDDLIDNRFEKAKLYKKLLCIMGETNFTIMEKTSLLKKLTGQDLIGFEFKNKDPFDDYNYAKIIIASNSLPSSSDTSEGFYRRWLIINFNNEFNEGKDILDEIPETEYENLARKSIRILKELLDKGMFHKQGSIEKRREDYIKASNPLIFFLKEECQHGETLFIKANDLYSGYVKYLQKQKKRIVTKKEFYKILGEEGYYSERTSKKINDDWISSMWISGISLLSGVSCMSAHSKPHIESPSMNLCMKVMKVMKIAQIHELNELGINEDSISQLKAEGYVYESPTGVIRLI